MAEGLMRVLARMPLVDRNVVLRALMRPPALTEKQAWEEHCRAWKTNFDEKARHHFITGYRSARS